MISILIVFNILEKKSELPVTPTSAVSHTENYYRFYLDRWYSLILNLLDHQNTADK